MMTKCVFAALLTVPVLAMASPAHARPQARHDGATIQGSYGRQVEAPPWSFACMTDHGPSRCGQPMWVYGRAE
jgi:hypothetical protein